MIHTVATVKEGVLSFHEPVLVSEELNKLEGHTVEVLIKPSKTRTSKQNNYYWGTVIYMIRERWEQLGYQAQDFNVASGNLTRELVHLVLSETYAQFDVYDPINQEVIGTTKLSTKEMSTYQFSQYVERLRQYAAENLDIDIPDPSYLYEL